MSTDNRYSARRQYRSVAFGTWKVGGARMSTERPRIDENLLPVRSQLGDDPVDSRHQRTFSICILVMNGLSTTLESGSTAEKSNDDCGSEKETSIIPNMVGSTASNQGYANCRPKMTITALQ
ncbi:hypothetical protein TELCIR_14692, partial [Teladorsagia circumcincta]